MVSSKTAVLQTAIKHTYTDQATSHLMALKTWTEDTLIDSHTQRLLWQVSCSACQQSSCPSSLVLGSAGRGASPGCGGGKAQLYPFSVPPWAVSSPWGQLSVMSPVESIFHHFSNGHQAKSLRMITRGFRGGFINEQTMAQVNWLRSVLSEPLRSLMRWLKSHLSGLPLLGRWSR